MLAKIVIIGLLAWGFFSPAFASWIFIGWLIIYEGFIFFNYLSGRKLQIKGLTPSENQLVQKFNLSFRYPFIARKSSKSLVMIAFVAIVWVILLIINKQYIQAVIILLNLYLANKLAYLNNPVFYSGNVSEKDYSIKREKEEFMRLFNKLHNNNKEKHEE